MRLILLIYLLPLLTFSQIQIGQDIDGEAENDLSSNRLSLSSDGSIVAIGAYRNDGNGIDSGHVRIYKNNNGVWTQIGQDIDGNASDDMSGIGLSLSADGSIVAIGASQFSKNNASGYVRVYKNNNDIWTQIGQDIIGESPGDYCGELVSLSSDGSIVAISAPANDGNGTGSGHVRVYKNNNDTWTQVGQDIDGEAENNFSGSGLSLSADGSIVAIGATVNSDNGNQSGQVRVYENNNGVWTQVGQDINGEASGDYSGIGLSLSYNGNIVAIGARGNDENGDNSGNVRVFQNLSGTWTQIGQNIRGEASGDESGVSLSLSADGSIVAIGSRGNDGNGTDSGSVRIYKNNNGAWTQIGSDIDGEASSDNSGSCLSLSSNANIIAISATGNDGNGSNSGHVRIYNLSSILSNSQSLKSDFKIFPNPASDYVQINIPNNSILNNVNIYNNIGQLIFTGNTSKIITRNFKKGYYIFEVITNNGKNYSPLIITE